MISKLRYGNSVIKYQIIKSKRRKTSEIRVDEKGVEVHTPITKKDSEIQDIIDTKKQWIFKKQLEFADRKKRKFKTTTKTSEYLEKRAWKLAENIGVKPKKIVVKNLKSRWGSAGKTGTITLNQALIHTPPRIIDYVIIHELCHLRIKGHSRRFWNLLSTYDKNYEKKIMWLDISGKDLE